MVLQGFPCALSVDDFFLTHPYIINDIYGSKYDFSLDHTIKFLYSYYMASHKGFEVSTSNHWIIFI